MNEMIPKPNTIPAERTSPAEEVIIDPAKLTEVTELAPSVLSLEQVAAELDIELDAASDNAAVVGIFKAAIESYGHQTVETILLTRFNNEPTEENRACLKLIGKMNEVQTIPAQESLKDPEFEGMESLLNVVNRYTQEQINTVASITTPAEAFASAERKRMKDDVATVYKIACKLRWETKADLDTDHTLYPEFWQIFEKFQVMHQAVGAINMIEKTVRRDILVR